MSNTNKNDPVALRVDYRKIDSKCYICAAPSTVIRFTQATDGEVYISSLCSEHAIGEQEHIEEEGELEAVPGTGTFVNFTLYDKLQSAAGMQELRDVIDEATSKTTSGARDGQS